MRRHIKMALRFTSISLEDENGNLYLISHDKLLQECLNHSYDTIKVSRIVMETICNMTGERVIPRGYNQSRLFCWIESKIHKDPRYITAKENIMQQSKKQREGEQQYRQAKMRVTSEEIEKKKRQEMLGYYRRRYR